MEMLPSVWKSDRTYAPVVVVHTNVTEVKYELGVTNYKLFYNLVGEDETDQVELDFGTVGVNEGKSLYFNLSNPGAFSYTIQRLTSNVTNLSVEFEALYSQHGKFICSGASYIQSIAEAVGDNIHMMPNQEIFLCLLNVGQSTIWKVSTSSQCRAERMSNPCVGDRQYNCGGDCRRGHTHRLSNVNTNDHTGEVPLHQGHAGVQRSWPRVSPLISWETVFLCNSSYQHVRRSYRDCFGALSRCPHLRPESKVRTICCCGPCALLTTLQRCSSPRRWTADHCHCNLRSCQGQGGGELYGTGHI